MYPDRPTLDFTRACFFCLFFLDGRCRCSVLYGNRGEKLHFAGANSVSVICHCNFAWESQKRFSYPLDCVKAPVGSLQGCLTNETAQYKWYIISHLN
jgi:hypothetical protein